jgi:membrane protease YdiL (CAAX protease family)
MPYIISCLFVTIVWAVIVYLNERHGLLRCDRFPSAGAKYGAYALLEAFFLLMAYLVTGSALAPVTSSQLTRVSFSSLFVLHALLAIFLLFWWLLSGRPPLREFLNIRHERPAEVVWIGVAAGVGGWLFTIVVAMIVALTLRSAGFLQEPSAPPPMIGWMANLAAWKKMVVILSAMTVEEAFFRSFLQKRIGLVASTLLFALAHFTYGNPLLLIGVTLISLVIGATFYRTKNVLPGVIAHGVFDAIQLFVIVPFALKMMSTAA